MILAAGRDDPLGSVETWLRGAIARRVLLRFLIASAAAAFCVVAGFLLLIVGAFFIAGIVALAQPAAALERRSPFDALARSAELGDGRRISLAILYGLFALLPGVVIQLGKVVDLRTDFPGEWAFSSVLSTALFVTGSIVLTRAFIALGGRATPGPEDVLPRTAEARPRA